MLIQFSVENYRSFKTLATLSLEASVDKEHLDNTFSVQEKMNLLKSAVLYGANSSGKSNLFQAIEFMRQFVLNSSNAQVTSTIPVQPFLLSTETETAPSHFEIILLHENIRYRYGFEVTKNIVVSEWFFSTPKSKETRLFTRDQSSGIDVNSSKFPEGKKALIDRTRANSLFLTTVAQFNGEISTQLISAFNKINIISGLKDEELMKFSSLKLKDESTKKDLLSFIHSIDINIEDFSSRNIPLSPDKLPSIFTEKARQAMAKELSESSISIQTQHKKYNKDNKLESIVLFDLGAHESAGTNKIFLLTAPILDTLENGKTLFVDEMDARLHPKIMEYIISLFNSKESNPNNAQLIFNAHTTLILCKEYFRRDQIWFVDKDKYGASNLYSLDDYSVRKESSFEKDYLLGKFGGLPIISYDDPEKK